MYNCELHQVVDSHDVDNFHVEFDFIYRVRVEKNLNLNENYKETMEFVSEIERNQERKPIVFVDSSNVIVKHSEQRSNRVHFMNSETNPLEIKVEGE